MDIASAVFISMCVPRFQKWNGAETLVQWLEQPAWKVADHLLVPRTVIQVPKKHKFLPRSLVNLQYHGEFP